MQSTTVFFWSATFALIFAGAWLNAYGLWIDYTHPIFFRALDFEIAGCVLIAFGFMSMIATVVFEKLKVLS